MNDRTGEYFELADCQGGKAVSLKGVSAQVELAGLLAHTVICQRFCNKGRKAIEAVYSFPLPLDGVLLDIEIEIAGQVLRGVVREKGEAREQFEDAIIDGNGAFLLRQLGEGHFQMNVGNLKPKESVEIRIKYAQILRWCGDTLRYRLPTVIAPHYGDPRRAGIDTQDAPTTDVLAEYPFSLTARISGALADGEISCPTHKADYSRRDGLTVLTLNRSAQLDRDFVLSVRQVAPAPWEVIGAPDGDAWAALGCLNAPIPDFQVSRKRHDLTILIDCSGSMAGDSITQVRRAMAAILSEMDDGDTLSVVRFGSRTDCWTPKPITLNVSGRVGLGRKFGELEADLGGTEILAGIEEAIARSKSGGDILLLTDGQANVEPKVLTKLAGKGHRFFTVGIGSAVSENIVRHLADFSNGFCELVTPNEAMAERIVAHFRRMRAPKARLSIDWGAPMLHESKVPTAVFTGDTVTALAVLRTNPDTPIRACLEFDKRRQVLESKMITTSGELAINLPRVAAWERLKSLPQAQAVALALKYQLVSEHTSMIAVLERAEGDQVIGLPDLVAVPQMLPAGAGSTVAHFGIAHGIVPSDTLRAELAQFESPAHFRVTRALSSAKSLVNSGMDRYDIPAFLRKKANDLGITDVAKRVIGRFGLLDQSHLLEDGRTPGDLLLYVKAIVQVTPASPLALDFDALEKILPETLINRLREIANAVSKDEGGAIDGIALCLALIEWALELSGIPTRDFRDVRLAVKRSIHDLGVHAQLKSVLAAALSGSTASRWSVTGLIQS